MNRYSVPHFTLAHVYNDLTVQADGWRALFTRLSYTNRASICLQFKRVVFIAFSLAVAR